MSQPPWTPRFDFYIATLDGDPAAIALDMGAADHAPIRTHRRRLAVRIAMKQARPDGLRSREELGALTAIEERGPISIHEVIERALVFCEHVLDQGAVTVERAFVDVPPIRGVAGQLTQVFVNLFTNAAHAMRGRGGRLGITTAPTLNGRDVSRTKNI